jgi:hypothetical protein
VACVHCGYRERFAAATAARVQAAVLAEAAGRCAGGADEPGCAAAFAARLRRSRPTDADPVALVLCLVDEAGAPLAPLTKTIEARVTVPAGRRAEAPALYVEGGAGRRRPRVARGPSRTVGSRSRATAGR